jgi:hypothetical protein
MVTKKPKPLTKENLETFCIETPAVRYNPGVAAALSVMFGLDYTRIRLGWMNTKDKARK